MEARVPPDQQDNWLKQDLPSFRVIILCNNNGVVLLCSFHTWLSLKTMGFKRMLRWLRLEADTTAFIWGKHIIDVLADPSRGKWSYLGNLRSLL